MFVVSLLSHMSLSCVVGLSSLALSLEHFEYMTVYKDGVTTQKLGQKIAVKKSKKLATLHLFSAVSYFLLYDNTLPHNIRLQCHF